MRNRTWSVVAAALFSVAASAGGQATADARKGYDAYLQALRTAVLKGDAAGIAALVTEDRTSVGGSGHVTTGRALQLSQDREFFRTSTVKDFEMQVTDFRSSGTLAYATGIGSHVVVDKNTGKEERDQFRFVEILVQQRDGRWLSQYFMNTPFDGRK